MTIRLQSRHVKREFPEGAVQVVAKKLRRSLCNTKGAPEMTELEELQAECDQLTAMDVSTKHASPKVQHTIDTQGAYIRALIERVRILEANKGVAVIKAAMTHMNEALADRDRFAQMNAEAKELDGKARNTIACQDEDIRRLVRLVGELESERAPLPTDSADFICGYNSGFNRCKKIKTRMDGDFDKTRANYDKARDIIATFVNNDPNDDAADGVTVFAVCQRDAARFLLDTK